MARLKEATAAQHRALEGTMTLMAEDVSLAAYREYLLRMLAVHAPFESAVAQLGELRDAVPDLGERMKLPLLEQDLAALDVPQTERASGSRIDWNAQSLPHALGALYVLEGSTLGGKVIFKHLDRVLGPRIEHAHAYLSAYGSGAMAMWRKLGSALQSFADAHGNEEQIVEGAVETFARMGRAWEKPAS